MKKLIFLLIIIFMIMIPITYKDNTNSITTFSETPNNNYLYYLLLTNYNVTTRNIDDYFPKDKYVVHEVYPKNNLSIDDEKINNRLQVFNYTSKEELEKEYIKILANYGLDEDIRKINLYGVNFIKISLYTTKENLEKLLSNYPKIKYSYSKEGFYN